MAILEQCFNPPFSEKVKLSLSYLATEIMNNNFNRIIKAQYKKNNDNDKTSLKVKKVITQSVLN